VLFSLGGDDVLTHHGKRLSVFAAILAVTLLLAAGLVTFGNEAISDALVAAAADMFLQIDGIRGEATE
jgi:hypothetical protein